jgi:hypothetical protein
VKERFVLHLSFTTASNPVGNLAPLGAPT